MRAAGTGRHSQTSASTHHTASTAKNHPDSTRRGVGPYSQMYAPSLAAASSAKARP